MSDKWRPTSDARRVIREVSHVGDLAEVYGNPYGQTGNGVEKRLARGVLRLAEHSSDLERQLAEAKADRERLKESLLDVLTQACIYYKDKELFDTGALSAYRDGWELAVKLGIAERDGELVGRRGFYRPKWEAIRALEESPDAD